MKPETIPSQQVKVLFLGPLGTYSHQAVRKFVRNEPADLIACRSIQDAVTKGAEDARLGRPVVVMVPVENSTLGIVQEALQCLSDPNLFFANGLSIVDEVDLTVAHALIIRALDSSVSNPLSRIEQVRSHEQALGQCSEFLNQHVPQAQRFFSNSTAEAVSYLRHAPAGRVAAVASELCAEMFGMQVIARNIQKSNGMYKDNVV